MTQFPISKYVGKHPNGKWIFIQMVEGTKEQALAKAAELQSKDNSAKYRLWDDR